ncbi:MAG: 4-alpha-glucanotransferase [Candidatus Omnitrophica bacterium]|nr:4-alpha-glucanotransferase [Candidatus Omnitrophota bacterium]
MPKSLKRSSGVLVPLFSVYSKESLGIGEFPDIKLLVDWCAATGNSIIQLLPMNEVGPTFCPYDSISSFALEPMYISIRLLKGAKPKSPGKISDRVDYRIKQEKELILREIYAREGYPASNDDFNKFMEGNSYWLDDYALFKALKVYNAGSPWYEWNDGYKNRDGYLMEEFSREHRDELDFYKWVQWQAFSQFKAARKYARSKGVSLKGDLPILVSRDSADAWAHPDFFKLEYAAGAPPDMYCAKGQRWGMPTYNWGYIEADEFIYLKEKLKAAENFYDMLRVDHVVGLFRIWSIPYNEPMENKGLNGFFDPSDENIWGEQGRKLLLALKDNTKMLLCAEDLGVIPKICRKTLEEMQIPGNDVQRWMKDWQVKHDFLEPGEYRKMAVAMLSTHDTTNWPAWWENEAGTVDEELFTRKCSERGIDYSAIKDKLFDSERSRFGRLRWREEISSVDGYTSILGKRPEELKDFIELYENTYLEKEKLWKKLGMAGAMQEKASVKLMRAALGITAASGSILNIELITDLLFLSGALRGDPYNYRINRPGTVSPDNWSLRLPISLEELMADRVNGEIREMIRSSGRGMTA